MTPEQHAAIKAQVDAYTTKCGICQETVAYGDTKIHEEPILYAHEDGTPMKVFYGMPTVREYRICKTH